MRGVYCCIMLSDEIVMGVWLLILGKVVFDNGDSE
jgi:hypothetical protein